MVIVYPRSRVVDDHHIHPSALFSILLRVSSFKHVPFLLSCLLVSVYSLVVPHGFFYLPHRQWDYFYFHGIIFFKPRIDPVYFLQFLFQLFRYFLYYSFVFLIQLLVFAFTCLFPLFLCFSTPTCGFCHHFSPYYWRCYAFNDRRCSFFQFPVTRIVFIFIVFNFLFFPFGIPFHYDVFTYHRGAF